MEPQACVVAEYFHPRQIINNKHSVLLALSCVPVPAVSVHLIQPKIQDSVYGTVWQPANFFSFGIESSFALHAGCSMFLTLAHFLQSLIHFYS
jgi:hypothetical protein